MQTLVLFAPEAKEPSSPYQLLFLMTHRHGDWKIAPILNFAAGFGIVTGG